MASLMFLRLLATMATVVQLVAGEQTVGICRDKMCGDCPEKLVIQPHEDEYPSCGFWNATALMDNHTGYPAWEEGGYAPFLNIGRPDPSCQIIIRTPSSTDVPGCGVPVAAFHNPSCFQLPLQGIFMVSYCCGVGDCMQMPINNEDQKKRRAISNSILLPRSNRKTGNKKCNGRVTMKTRTPRLNITEFPQKVAWPGWGCPDWGSWRTLRKYTKPSSRTTAVSARIHRSAGGGSLSIGVTRTDSWTFTFGISIQPKGFPIHFDPSIAYMCQVADSETTSINVPAHASGHMAFTAMLVCEIGIFTCQGRVQEPQEICYPFKENDRLAGVYHLVTGD